MSAENSLFLPHFICIQRTYMTQYTFTLFAFSLAPTPPTPMEAPQSRWFLSYLLLCSQILEQVQAHDRLPSKKNGWMGGREGSICLYGSVLMKIVNSRDFKCIGDYWPSTYHLLPSSHFLTVIWFLSWHLPSTPLPTFHVLWKKWTHSHTEGWYLAGLS